MQQDFHFYTIYALARAAGFNGKDAHIISYASQHTDDAKYDHHLEFENGGRFEQVLTAHRFFHPDAITKVTCNTIYIPFHFLPGNSETGRYKRMITQANSKVAQRMINDFLKLPLKPYSLHHLGIILHVYADTWSHQRFTGIKHYKINDVKKLKVKGETRLSIKKMFNKLKGEGLEYLAPKIGHAQAGTIPDEPYREWQYYNYEPKRTPVSNPKRALQAAQNCYAVLLSFLKRFPQYASGSRVAFDDAFKKKLLSLFEANVELDERIEAWQGAIAGGILGFTPEQKDRVLNYDDREWFRDAVEVKKTRSKKERYKRRRGFEKKNWKYFHEAAACHKSAILDEILPAHRL